MQFKRTFTSDNIHPSASIKWTKFHALIKDGDKIVFEQKDVLAPDFWSQSSVDIAASKYFRGSLGTAERETSVGQLIDRVVKKTVEWSFEGEYFTSKADAEVFEYELYYLLVHQFAAFNSPVWFNLGAEGRNQAVNACFIQSVDDSMESILDYVKNEGMLFKDGSGSGANLSNLRSSLEALKAGGTSSGPVSFMKGADMMAGAIKSGGATRRAAKMCILNADHPDIEEFVDCKVESEKMARALIAAGFNAEFNVKNSVYAALPFQNANHSVRVTDKFMEAVQLDKLWNLRRVTDHEVTKTLKAKDLFHSIAIAAHACGDPGIQFDDVTNKWHTCKASGRINASNPCALPESSLLTPQGIKMLANIKIGDAIWSGKQWTKVTAKWSTGVKPTFKFHTRAGSFYGTGNHRIVQNGKKTEIRDAESIDTTQGPAPCSSTLDPQDVMNGLVFGDGTHEKKRGADKVVLVVGQDDQDYFTSEVRHLLHGPIFESEPLNYVVESMFKALPKTYDREVPTKYHFGTEKEVRGFLRGLYSANGSIVDNRITLKAASFRVIEIVQEMLSSIGIKSYYTTNKAHDVEFSNGTYTCRQSYDLNITVDRKLFQELIGFIHKDKQERLQKAIKGVERPNKGKRTYEIVSVEPLGDREVWDLTVEAEEHTFWCNGLLVSNCSEFVFLDETACNLASLNLLKFYDGETFDYEKFEAACRIMITAQEIFVSFSHYPTEKIKQNSIAFRPLGLGYANLGALLMVMGIPYDSDDGRNIAAVITSLMSASAYHQSAIIAQEQGAFSGFEKNREHVLDVLAMHGTASDSYATGMLNAVERTARRAVFLWNDLCDVADHYGVRNAQISVIAPTGTIGFLMGCDTTGLEPELALVKYKKLVGGGTMKIVNQNVERALRALEYDEGHIQALLAFVSANGTLEGSTLRAEHLPVFDCALPVKGGRVIEPMGHIKMMEAIQPFVSGAISKTVNCPASYAVKDIENIYVEAWKRGLKAVAFYRDGCKQSQPLNTSNEKVQVTVQRKRLPATRDSVTHRFAVGGVDGYVTAGLYEDKTPGEVFMHVSKEGSTISGLMDSFATVFSMALQYGVPLKALTDKLKFTRFEPAGFTGNVEIRSATSIVDYVMHWLDNRFGSGEKKLQVSLVATHEAPTCNLCGGATARAGSCHVCTQCGTTTGCS